MFNGRRQPSCGGTSRISREAYVRFCEGLGVKFPGPTRRSFKSRGCMTALAWRAEVTAAPPSPSKNDLDVKEIVNLWAGGSAAVKSMLGRH